MAQSDFGKSGPLACMADALRQLRRRAGNPTYRAMQRRANYSISVLSRVQSGKRLPSLEALKAFVEACDGEVDFWEEQYIAVRRALRTGTTVRLEPWRGASGLRIAQEQSVAKGMLGSYMREIQLRGKHDIEAPSSHWDLMPKTCKHGKGEVARVWADWGKISPAFKELLDDNATFQASLEHQLRREASCEAYSQAAVRNAYELAAEMQRLRRGASLTLQEVTARISDAARDPELKDLEIKPVSLSTIGNLCDRRHGRVPSIRTLRAFLWAVGVDDLNIEYWLRVRQRLIKSKPSRGGSQRVVHCHHGVCHVGWKGSSWRWLTVPTMIVLNRTQRIGRLFRSYATVDKLQIRLDASERRDEDDCYRRPDEWQPWWTQKEIEAWASEARASRTEYPSRRKSATERRRRPRGFVHRVVTALPRRCANNDAVANRSFDSRRAPLIRARAPPLHHGPWPFMHRKAKLVQTC